MNHQGYLYVFDGMSDWEVAYLTAELNTGRYFKPESAPMKIVTVGQSKEPIRTMGGLRVMPDIGLDDYTIENTAVLLLPGGDSWLEPIHEPILMIAEECLKNDIAVGAICGATFGLAKKGILDTRYHTSNDLDYLKMVCPSYSGDQFYDRSPAVTDGRLVTASGTAPLEFTAHILAVLEAVTKETLGAWLQLYKTNEPDAFYILMNTLNLN